MTDPMPRPVVRFVEDVEIGQEGPVVTHVLTRTDLVRYAGASGDYNPVHHDEPFALAAGQRSVFGHGMLSMGLLGTAIGAFVGPVALSAFRVRFNRQTWPGEELVTSVVVSGIRAEGDRHLVDLQVSLASREGEVKVTGVATAALPSRDPTPTTTP